MRTRIVAASARITSGTKRRSPRCCWLGLGGGPVPGDTDPPAGDGLCASTDLSSSAICLTYSRPSAFFADRLLELGLRRPVTQQRMLVPVIGFGERCLGLQDI